MSLGLLTNTSSSFATEGTQAQKERTERDDQKVRNRTCKVILICGIVCLINSFFKSSQTIQLNVFKYLWLLGWVCCCLYLLVEYISRD